MATRGEAISQDLKALTDSIKKQNYTFGSFFEEAPVKSQENAGKNTHDGVTPVIS